MKLLNFMIVGVQKSGTTALSHFLAQHPEIAMAEGKEVHLFDAQDYENAWDKKRIQDYYAPFFSSANSEQLYAEATPIYCYWPEIAEQLHRYNPALKLILVLRDPVARALSHYAMERGRGNESLPLWLALLLEPVRLVFSNNRVANSSSRCHSYTDRGFYSQQITNLLHYFTPEQLLIIDNTELLSQHHATMTKVLRFLAVDENYTVEQEQVFAGDYTKQSHKLCAAYLRWRFRRANRQLKSHLFSMGYSPNWPWLG